MKKYIISLFLLLCFIESTYANSYTPYHRDYYKRYENEQSQEFFVVNHNKNIYVDTWEGGLGHFNKSSFTLRTIYNYNDQHGEFRASGTLRFLSLGEIFTSLSKIDVTNEADHHIGSIEGTLFTTSSSKYYIKDHQGYDKAIAYLEPSGSSFKIVSYENEKIVLARLDRAFVANNPDYWHLRIIQPKAIDYRVLLMFACFIADNQNQFDTFGYTAASGVGAGVGVYDYGRDHTSYGYTTYDYVVDSYVDTYVYDYVYDYDTSYNYNDYYTVDIYDGYYDQPSYSYDAYDYYDDTYDYYSYDSYDYDYYDSYNYNDSYSYDSYDSYDYYDSYSYDSYDSYDYYDSYSYDSYDSYDYYDSYSYDSYDSYSYDSYSYDSYDSSSWY